MRATSNDPDRFQNADCSHEEKARRIRGAFKELRLGEEFDKLSADDKKKLNDKHWLLLRLYENDPTPIGKNELVPQYLEFKLNKDPNNPKLKRYRNTTVRL